MVMMLTVMAISIVMIPMLRGKEVIMAAHQTASRTEAGVGQRFGNKGLLQIFLEQFARSPMFMFSCLIHRGAVRLDVESSGTGIMWNSGAQS